MPMLIDSLGGSGTSSLTSRTPWAMRSASDAACSDGGARQDHDELLAAVPRHEVGGARVGAQHGGHGLAAPRRRAGDRGGR